jgi:hypothetical protein
MRLLPLALPAALLCGLSLSGARATAGETPRSASDDQKTSILGDLPKLSSPDQVRFALGASQFLEAVEHLGQSLHKYGFHAPGLFRMLGGMPVIPIPENAGPDQLTHAILDQIIKDFSRELGKAEQTLAGIKDDNVKLSVRLASIKLDLKGDGKRDTPLVHVMAQFFQRNGALPGGGDLLVVFDRGDVAWLRAYCHLLEAMCEFVLAHDAREFFDIFAPQVFGRVQTKYSFIGRKGDAFPHNGGEIADLIAAIHVLHLPVRDPARMKAALEHLEQMIKLGRESWKYILAETDDDHEWIPNPKQKGVLGVPVRQDMVDSWMEFLDETEALLQGKRLAPFWRGNGSKGVNLRRVFLEPKTFDLVMWVQGAAAVPYLEEGQLTKKEVWNRLLRVFQGEFIGFAFWFN